MPAEPFCPFGAEVISGSPAWFSFTEADILAFAPPLASTFTIIGLGLPTAPQNTADFVAAGPPTELAGDADILLLAFPLVAMASGAYRRIGNSIRAAKWASLAVCKAPPPAPEGVTLPDEFHYLGHVCLTRDPGNFQRLWYSYGLVAQSGQRLGMRFTTDTWQDYLAPEDWWWSEQPPDLGGDPYTPRNIDLGIQNATNAGTINPLTGHESDNWYTFTAPPTGKHYLSLVEGHNYPTVDAEVCFDLAIQILEPQPEVVPPEPPAFPTGYPTGGGVCETPSLGDLCRSLSAINAKIDALIERTSPPALVAPDEPVPVEPVPDPPPEGPTPSQPVARPVRATGAVVTCKVIPEYAARFGTNPLYYPALGFAAEMTQWGPRPSVQLKHTPLVLLALSPQTETLQLDLAEGVQAEILWLYAA